MRVPYAPTVPLSHQGAEYFRAADYSALDQGLNRAFRGLGALGAAIEEKQSHQDRFQALSDFSQFESNVNDGFSDIQRNTVPGDKTVLARTTDMYEQKKNEFLKTVPPALQDEFSYRADQVKQSLHNDAAGFDLKQQDLYYHTGVSDLVNKAKEGVNADPTTLPTWKGRVYENIDASGLSAADKFQLKRTADTALSGIGYFHAVKKELNGAAAGQDYYTRLAQVESGNNPDAYNASSGAAGSFQFVPSTARRYGLPSDARQASDAQQLSAVKQLTNDNAIYLVQKLGRAPSPGELYLAHQQGAAGAVALLSHPNELAVDVVGEQAVKQNGGAPGMTAQQFANKWIGKFEGVSLGLGTSPADSNPQFASVPFEDRQAIRKDAITSLTDEYNAAQKQDKEAKSAAINDLLIGIDDGSKGKADVESSIQSGLLSDFEQRRKVEEFLQKKQNDVSGTADITAQLSSGLPFDQTDSATKKNYNSFFKETGGMAAIQAQNQDYITNTFIPTAQKAQDIPTDAAGTLAAMSRSQDSAQAIYALNALSLLKQQAPDAFAARIPHSTASDVQLWEQNNLLPQNQLLDVIRGGNTPELRAATQQLRDRGQRILTDKNEPGHFDTSFASLAPDLFPQSALASFFSGTPQNYNMAAASLGFERDFQPLFIYEYSRFGDPQLARTVALNDLKRVYGVTQVGGKDLLMKYPPELSGYGAGSSQWITSEVRTGLGLTPDQSFELFSDNQTASELAKFQADPNAPPPSYRVILYDKSGAGTIPPSFAGAGGKNRMYFVKPESAKAFDAVDTNYNNAKYELDKFMTDVYAPAVDAAQHGVTMPLDLAEQKANMEAHVLEIKKSRDQLQPHAVPVKPISSYPGVR